MYIFTHLRSFYVKKENNKMIKHDQNKYKDLKRILPFDSAHYVYTYLSRITTKKS